LLIELRAEAIEDSEPKPISEQPGRGSKLEHTGGTGLSLDMRGSEGLELHDLGIEISLLLGEGGVRVGRDSLDLESMIGLSLGEEAASVEAGELVIEGRQDNLGLRAESLGTLVEPIEHDRVVEGNGSIDIAGRSLASLRGRGDRV